MAISSQQNSQHAFGVIFQHKYLRYYAIALVGITFVLLLATLRDVLLLGVLLSLNALLSIVLRPFKRFLLGIELVTLSSVLAGMVYGPGVGILFSALSLAVNFLFMQRITLFTLLVLPAYAGIGILSAFFSVEHITSVGILFSVVYNLIVSLLIFSFFQGKLMKCAVFSMVNIMWNVVVFSYLAPSLIRVFL